MQRVVGCLLLPGSLLRRPLNGSWGRKRDVSTPAATGVCSLVNWLARQMPTKRPHTPTQTHKASPEETQRIKTACTAQRRRGCTAGATTRSRPIPSSPEPAAARRGTCLWCPRPGRRRPPSWPSSCARLPKTPPRLFGVSPASRDVDTGSEGGGVRSGGKGGGDGGEAETRVREGED